MFGCSATGGGVMPGGRRGLIMNFFGGWGMGGRALELKRLCILMDSSPWLVVPHMLSCLAVAAR